MDVLGNFCSWNCASQYIDTFYSGEKKWEKHELLKMLYTIFTNKHIDYIVPSPPKTMMKQYGGHQTEHEYREMLMTLNKSYQTSMDHNKIKTYLETFLI